MFKKDALFEIIQSLNQEEIRNFYRNVNTKTGKDKNYLVLFELLRKQKKADDKSTIDVFIRKTGVKSFGKTKEYLMELVFNSLEKHPAIQNSYYEILDKIYLAEVFFKKGILHVSEELIRKVKELIEETEYYDHTDRVFHLMSRLYKKGALPAEEAHHYLTEYKVNTLRAANIREFRILEVQFHFFMKQFKMGGNNEKVKEFLMHPLLEGEFKAITNSSKIMFHNIMREYYLSIEDFQKVFFHSKQIMDIYDGNLGFQSHHPVHYLRSLANLGDASLLMNQESLFAEIKDMFEKNEHKVKNNSSVLFLYKFHCKFLILRQKAKYREGLELIKDFNETIERRGIRMYEALEITQLLNMIVFYFANNEFKSLSKCLRRMGELIEKKEFINYFMLHKILELLRSYEQQDYEFCESQIRSIKRFSEKIELNSELTQVYNAIIQLVREESGALPNHEKINEIFCKLRKDLDQYRKTTDLELFPFRNWSLAKCKNISMLDLEEIEVDFLTFQKEMDIETHK